MTAYEVKLSGCDESARFVVHLADDEAALLERVAALSREASTYSCEPVMSVTRITEGASTS